MTVSLLSMKIWEGRHLLILLVLIPQVEILWIRINIKESRQQQGLNFRPLLWAVKIVLLNSGPFHSATVALPLQKDIFS